MMSFGRRCDQHMGALLDFVDRREIRPGTGPALDHLGRCATCARELEVTALAIVALRRLYQDVAAIEPPVDAWARLRSRIDRPSRPTYGLRSPILGSVVASALVAAIGLQAVVLPTIISPRVAPPLTNRDAFDPTIRMIDAPGDVAPAGIIPRRTPDGDVSWERPALSARHVSIG
jgi:hypothetical protein